MKSEQERKWKQQYDEQKDDEARLFVKYYLIILAGMFLFMLLIG